MLVKTKAFDVAQLARFKELQRKSFAILEGMAAELVLGQSEKQIARELVKRYRKAGFTSFFHLPVVLFGARTALPGEWDIGKFFPKNNTLAEGYSVILDASPICAGFLVDTSYSFCFGDNPTHRDMMTNLSAFRASICAQVNAGQSFKAIADDVSAQFAALGYEPVHGKHPGSVLGHRAVKLLALPFAWRIQGFDGLSLTWFRYKDRLANSFLGGKSPLWNNSVASDHPPHDGLWLVEPHAGCRTDTGAVGAKWEEILVIEQGKAYWLDDDPPHLRQWAQIAAGTDYQPRAGVKN